jgi:hypothetical protein
LSIVTVVRGSEIRVCFDASDPAVASAAALAAVRLGSAPLRPDEQADREGEREGEEKHAGRSEQRHGDREEDADDRVLPHGLLERGPRERGRLRATTRILATHRACRSEACW